MRRASAQAHAAEGTTGKAVAQAVPACGLVDLGQAGSVELARGRCKRQRDRPDSQSRGTLRRLRRPLEHKMRASPVHWARSALAYV